MATSPIYIDFEIPGKPVPKGRPRFAGRAGCSGAPVVYTPKTTAEYERKVRRAAEEQMTLHRYDPTEDALALEVIFYMRRPKSVPPSRRFPSVKPDIDNLLKAVVDGMNGVVYADDKLVVDVHVAKRYALAKDEPRVVVRAWSAGHRQGG